MGDDFQKPKIIDEEVLLEPNKTIMCKTDKFGIFEFANDYFIEISGYEEWELMGKSMFCVQHPDMPEVIFKHLWEKLLNKEEAHVVVKNLTKEGKYYWSLTSFTFKTDDNTDEIIAIYSKLTIANKESIDFFSKFYKTLINIENNKGIVASEKYAKGFLEEKQTDLNGLVSKFYPNSLIEIKTQLVPKIISTPKTAVNEKIIVPPKVIKNEFKKERPIISQKKLSDSIENNSENKSFFQKWFGKTEEELEEERKRKKS